MKFDAHINKILNLNAEFDDELFYAITGQSRWYHPDDGRNPNSYFVGRLIATGMSHQHILELLSDFSEPSSQGNFRGSDRPIDEELFSR